MKSASISAWSSSNSVRWSANSPRRRMTRSASFWGLATPANPNGIADIFLPQADVVGSGYNTQSYSNPRLTQLIEEARNLPGCDVETRKAMYGEAYQILRDDSPWIWISTGNVLLAAQANVENWAPRPGGSRWNIDAWTVAES